MKRALSRSAIPVLAVLMLAAAGIVFAQSGSAPSGTPAPASRTAAVAEAPKVIALQFYADWCPGCNVLTPKLEEAMQDASSQPCLFVKLDQTDKASHQAEYMLAAMGLGDLWKEHAGKTGYVLLVDGKTRKVLSTITSKQETKEIKATLMAALMR